MSGGRAAGALWVAASLALVAPAPARALRVPKAVVDQLEREVAACKVRLDEVRDRSDRCSEDSPPPPVYTELLQAFSGSEVEVLREGPRVMLVLPGELLFPPTELVVRGEAAFVIDLVGTALRLHPELHVWLVGHMHDGPVGRNLARLHPDRHGLAFAEAVALRDALAAASGASAGRFTLSSRGATQPLSEGDSPEGRAKNHRLVLVLGPPDPWR